LGDRRAVQEAAVGQRRRDDLQRLAEALASFTAVSGIAFVSTSLIGSLTVPPDADTLGVATPGAPATTSADGHHETPR
jgi:hypothetical protein